MNVALKDHQVLYATENRSLKDNRQLLMVPGFRSKKVFDANAPAPPVFPVNVLLGSKPATSNDIVLPQSDHLMSSIVSAVVHHHNVESRHLQLVHVRMTSKLK